MVDKQDDDPLRLNEGVSDDAIPPLKVMDETKYLEDELGEILFEVYERGRVSLDKVAGHVDRPKTRVKKDLGELRKQGYLGVDYESDKKRYYVRSDWGTQEFPSGPIIPLVYQYNLLSDKQRMDSLRRAIDETVGTDDTVADLGAGVGVLSHIAAETAEHVYSVEIDREVYEKGKELAEGKDNIEFIRGDARSIELPEDVDVILCELLDTALITELQVPVMNHAIENLTSSEFKTVPKSARTSMSLINTDYEFFEYEFRLPHFEEYGSRESVLMSEKEVYHEVSFNETNPEIVEETVTLKSSEGGVVNGIQLNTNIRFADRMEMVGSSPWLNPPLNLPFDEDREVGEGEAITVEVSYELGGNLNDVLYEIVE